MRCFRLYKFEITWFQILMAKILLGDLDFECSSILWLSFGEIDTRDILVTSKYFDISLQAVL